MTAAAISYLLRPIRAADIDALEQYLNDPKILRFLPTKNYPMPRAEIETLMTRILTPDDRNILYAVEIEGTCAGAVGLHNIADGEGALAGWMARKHHGTGIAVSAAREMMEYGFAKLGLSRIVAPVLAGNKASERLLCKLGFTLIHTEEKKAVKEGVAYDRMLYAKERSNQE